MSEANATNDEHWAIITYYNRFGPCSESKECVVAGGSRLIPKQL